MYPIYYLDFMLKDIFTFLNFAKNNTFLMYDDPYSLWEFIYDEYVNISFFNISRYNLYYYTIFDFKKYFIGVTTELFEKKLAMLYYYQNVRHFSLFLLDLNLEIFKIAENLKFESFGIYLITN